MRSCCSLYVDAGYLLASAATRVSGSSLRSGIMVDHRQLIGGIADLATGHCNLPLLRTLWYDSMSRERISRELEEIGVLPKVKLRLGRLSPSGEQKGVDLRLGLDLVAHARTGSIDVAYLVSGDDDLSEAVEEAQALGVQVVAVSVADAQGRAHGLAHHLRLTVDEVVLLPGSVVDAAVTRRRNALVGTSPAPTAAAAPKPTGDSEAPSPRLLADLARGAGTSAGQPLPQALPSPASIPVYTSVTGQISQPPPDTEEYSEQIDRVVRRVLQVWEEAASRDDVRRLWSGQPSIPSDIDRALLMDLSDEIQEYDIPEQVRFALRARFWSSAQEILGEG